MLAQQRSSIYSCTPLLSADFFIILMHMQSVCSLNDCRATDLKYGHNVIRVKFGEGIAGTVAKTGVLLFGLI